PARLRVILARLRVMRRGCGVCAVHPSISDLPEGGLYPRECAAITIPLPTRSAERWLNFVLAALKPRNFSLHPCYLVRYLGGIQNESAIINVLDFHFDRVFACQFRHVVQSLKLV